MMRFPLAAAAVAVVAAAAGSWMALASDPASHDVTVPTVAGQSVTVEWTGIVTAGSTAVTNSCGLTPVTSEIEDHHVVNLTVPAGTYDAVEVTATFSIAWEPGTSTPAANFPDLVLTVQRDGEEVGSSDGGEPMEAVVTTNPEAGVFDAIACPYAADEDVPYTGKLVLTAVAAGSGGPVGPPVAGLGNAAGLPPRFHNYAPDYPVDGFGMFGGEATLDANWNSDSLFYLGFLETLRLRFDHATSPAAQTWDKMLTVASNKVTSDPILVSDHETGRVFSMQLLLGPGTSAMDYSDDDGETWTPGMAGSVLRSGADHQAMDVGPYPEGSPIPHPTYPNAVYYCSQDVAQAYCSRSDDGGVTFGPSVQIYTQANCNGLHGHVKVAEDGVVYVPNSKCTELGVGILSDRNAVAVSEDGGLTWAMRFVGETTSGGGSDPSIASASDGTVYLSYIDAEYRPHMVKSTDHGVTWVNDVDIGALAGITAAEFPAVIAGDPDRAAVAFYGTTFPGEDDPENGDGYGGEWHLYVATTYDGGVTYHVTDLTPNDAAQRGPICGGNYCRNLLDFFDAAIDPQGRMLIGYEDGCVGGCVDGGISQFSDQAVLARQSGGRSLFAAHDGAEPKVAGAPLTTGFRRQDYAVVEWLEPDTGGAEITEYRVYRAVGAGPMTLLRSTGKTRQLGDFGLDDALTYRYRVTAVNASGESAQGNELSLAKDANRPMTEQACALPGVRKAVDNIGESEAQPATRDIAEIYVAEPEDMPGKLVISQKIAQAAAPLQNGAYFFLYFDISGQIDRTWRARLSFDGSPVEYWDGTVTPTDDTLDWQRVYTAAGNLDPASGITEDGFVRFVFDKAALGVEKGDFLLAVNGRSFPGPRGSNVLTEEAGYFDYKLVGNDFCALGGIEPPPGTGPGTGPVVPVPQPDTDKGRFGGALDLALLFGLAGLGGLGAMRRRAR